MELFVAGGFWFWSLVISELIALFIFMEKESGVGATVSLAATLGALQWFGNVDIIGFAMHNPWSSFFLAIMYVMIGVSWGIIRWFLFCKKRAEKYNMIKQEYMESEGITDINDGNHKRRFKSYVESASRNIDGGNLWVAPSPAKHKADIIRWMGFWFVSLCWTFIDDFVKEFFNIIYYKLAGVYSRISKNIFKNIETELD